MRFQVIAGRRELDTMEIHQPSALKLFHLTAARDGTAGLSLTDETPPVDRSASLITTEGVLVIVAPPWPRTIEVNGIRVLAYKLLNRGDEVTIDHLTLRLIDSTVAVHQAGEPQAGSVCAFCQDRIVVGEEVLVCPSCGTVSHGDGECWVAGDRCHGQPWCGFTLDPRAGDPQPEGNGQP